MDDIPLDGKDDHPSTSAATNTSFHFHVPSPPPLDDILAGIHGGMDLTSSALTGPTTRMSLSALPNPIESSDMASHMASDMATSTAITKASTAFGSTFGSALEAAYARGEHAPPPVEVLRMSNEVSAMTGASLTMPLNMTGATSSTPAAHSFYKAAVDFHGLDEDALLFQSIGVGGLGSGLGADLAQELNDKLALTKGKKSGALVDADGRERADDTDDDDDVDEEDDGEEQRNIAHVHTVKSPTTATRRFDWENPRPEQMLVCDQRQAAEILDSLTDQLKCPPPATGGSSSAKLALANTAFLMARYAHYYGGGDVLDVVLSGLVMRVDRLARAHAQDLSFCAHWLANAVWLLYYLRREPQLRESTGMYQKQIVGEACASAVFHCVACTFYATTHWLLEYTGSKHIPTLGQ